MHDIRKKEPTITLSGFELTAADIQAVSLNDMAARKKSLQHWENAGLVATMCSGLVGASAFALALVAPESKEVADIAALFLLSTLVCLKSTEEAYNDARSIDMMEFIKTKGAFTGEYPDTRRCVLNAGFKLDQLSA